MTPGPARATAGTRRLPAPADNAGRSLVAAASTLVVGVLLVVGDHRRTPAGTGSGPRSSREVGPGVAARSCAGCGSTCGCSWSARSARSLLGLGIAVAAHVAAGGVLPAAGVRRRPTRTSSAGMPLHHRAVPVRVRRARAAAQRHPARAGPGRDRPRPHLLAPTSPRCSGPASSRCTRRSGPRRGRSGLSYRQTMRHVVLPQAVRTGRAAAAQRPRRDAEGRRAHLARRADRRDPGRADRDRRRPTTTRPTSWPASCSCCWRSR